MAQATNFMALDALKCAGLVEAKAALAVPLATGMSLGLVLLGLHLHWKAPPSKRLVLWSRIDQKSCLKAIATAGFEVVPVPLTLRGDELVTDLAAFKALLEEHGPRVLACVTTTSCFAPRAPDDVEGIPSM
jgi:O-phospho-L-seryl-tRNASec:L-selenocysteinyl-tRNA synthase